MLLLIVEDSVRMASLLRRGLLEEGYAVEVATTGIDAVWQATETTFHAIVLDVLLPGIVMEADPQIPDAYRQEFLAGQAEDTAWVVDRGETTTVPYGKVRNTLTTLEATALEPGAYDQKIYGPGLGIILEQALSGPAEVAKLVSVTGP